MTVSTVFLGIAIMSVGWGVVSSIVMVSYLQERGAKINFFLLRLLVIKYAAQYRDITREETGKTGPWFFSFVTGMNLGLICAIAGFVTR